MGSTLPNTVELLDLRQWLGRKGGFAGFLPGGEEPDTEEGSSLFVASGIGHGWLRSHHARAFVNKWVPVESHLAAERNSQGDEIMELAVGEAMILIPAANNNDAQKQIEGSLGTDQHVISNMLLQLIHLSAH